MKIEISDTKYWKQLNWDDAFVYCQMLSIDGKNDWRMIYSYKELSSRNSRESTYNHFIDGVWFWGDNNIIMDDVLSNSKLWVIPVRDV